MRIRNVTVVGATGTMGANIAGIFASFGDAKVYCIGRSNEKVKNTIPRIVNSVRADSIKENLIPADFSMIKECVSQSDLVFESLIEDITVKKEIAIIVSKCLPSGSYSCTGSSGLSIRKIAECYPEEKRSHFFGVHMFNPPYNLTLCELISTPYSDKTAKNELKDYLINILFRTVVEVKDSPAFLGNRIGFQLINEAMQFAEMYKDNGGVDYIDAIIGTFTGRTMPPLLTANFVGLDIHKAIVDNLYENTNDYARDSFVLPNFAKVLINENKLGRKTGMGLYKPVRYSKNLIKETVFDIKTGMYRDVFPYVFPFAEKMKDYISEGDYQKAFSILVNNHSLEAEICFSFMLKYIVYSLYTAQTVAYSIEAADDVMATGFNWCPPLAMVSAFSTVTDVNNLIKSTITDICKMIDVERLLRNIIPSQYDYRLFFKSGR